MTPNAYCTSSYHSCHDEGTTQLDVRVMPNQTQRGDTHTEYASCPVGVVGVEIEIRWSLT